MEKNIIKTQKPFLKTFSLPQRVHILGIAGILMGNIALFLKKQGVLVTGSDEMLYDPMKTLLKKAGIPVFLGYKSTHLEKLVSAPELVLIGNVIRKSNLEFQAIQKRGWNFISVPEFLESSFLNQTKNIVVCGTHGKTTTTALMIHVLESLGIETSYLLGGKRLGLQEEGFFISKKSPFFVLEGDEYDTAHWDKVPKFFHYRAQDILWTCCEYDHADIYDSPEAFEKVFEIFLREKACLGRRIVFASDKKVYGISQKILEEEKTRKEPPSQWIWIWDLEKSPQKEGKLNIGDYVLGQTRIEEGWTYFEVLEHGATHWLSVPLAGRYQARNALFAWVWGKELGFPQDQLKKALATFPGVARRQNVRGTFQGVKVIEDFAHHPTAVWEVIRAVKAQKGSSGKLWVFFEPRSAASRRRVFQKTYVESFLEADRIGILPPFDQSRIPQEDRFSSRELVEDLKKRGKEAFLVEAFQEEANRLKHRVSRGDWVLFLSNGAFEGFLDLCLKVFQD